MKKSERIFLVSVLVIAAVLWIGMKIYQNSQDYGSILISVAGQEYGSYPLSKDQVIEIGETNICEIKNQQVTMIHANCPDQLCMYQMPVGAAGGFIICLPNQVMIEGVPAKKNQKNGTAIDSIG